MDQDDVIYSTVEDVLAAAYDDCNTQGDLIVQARHAPQADVCFIDMGDLVGAAHEFTLGEPSGLFKRPGGFPRPGPGRTPGSALDVRESVYNVIVVLLSTSAFLNLTELF